MLLVAMIFSPFLGFISAFLPVVNKVSNDSCGQVIGPPRFMPPFRTSILPTAPISEKSGGTLDFFFVFSFKFLKYLIT